jgi:hypothetical protein
MPTDTSHVMTWIDVWSVASSIVSIFLAVFAVALSVWFFKESVRYAQDSTRAAASIDASVKKLETLFERLYSDTFSMMRDTYADMRKHVWPADEEDDDDVEERKAAEVSIEVLKQQLLTSVAEIVKRQTRSEEDISNIKQSIEKQESSALAKAVESTVEAIEAPRPVGADSARTRRLIRLFMRREARAGRQVTANDIVKNMRERGVDFDKVIDEMAELRRRNLLAWKGGLGGSTIVEAPDIDRELRTSVEEE